MTTKKTIETINRFAVVVDGGSRILINTTPHDLNFVQVDGTEVTVPTSVSKGEKSGPLVINARPVEVQVSDLFVRTEFKPDPTGLAVLDAIEEYATETGKPVVVIGSIIAVGAYPLGASQEWYQPQGLSGSRLLRRR